MYNPLYENIKNTINREEHLSDNLKKQCLIYLESLLHDSYRKTFAIEYIKSTCIDDAMYDGEHNYMFDKTNPNKLLEILGESSSDK